MPIAQVLLSNTFNEFRTTFNDAADTINSLQAGTGNSNVSFLTVSSGVSSNLIPSANVTFDLGTASQRWKDLYLSGNSIFLGDAEISYDGTTFKIIVGSDEIFTADDSGASVVESATANTITANTVTSNTITANTVTSNTITANSVTSNTITANSVTSNTITANTVTSNTITVNNDLTVAGNLSITGTTTLSDSVFSGNVTVQAQGDVRFADADSSNFVALQAPATIATNFILTLPTSDGIANQALITDGSGNLSFANVAAEVTGESFHPFLLSGM